VRSLIARVEKEQGQLDSLVNNIGAEHFAEFDKPIWEVDLERGIRLLRLAIDTHLITSHFALPLLIQKPGGLVVKLTDGTADYNKGK
jgi:NAD(P)-dependent dehydrogenase (short-subunit alcohol dehydrogenase family)